MKFVILEKGRTHGAKDRKKRKDRFYNRYSKLKEKMSEGKAFTEAKLQKAKPYTRTRRGKLEQVKGYASKVRAGFPPAALEEATIHQIRKDYLVTRDEAKRMYENMFGPERSETESKLKSNAVLSQHKFSGISKMVVATREPQIGDKVMWTGRHSSIGDPPDRPLRVVGFQGDFVLARDNVNKEYGVDLVIPKNDLIIVQPGTKFNKSRR